MNPALINAIYLSSVVSALIFFSILILAIIHDLRRPRVVSRLPKKKPHISIVVINQSSHRRTMRLLRSIATSSYRNCDVVLLDNLSGQPDVTQFRKERLRIGADFKLYKRLKRASLADAIREAYKRSKHGDIVLVLNSIDSIRPNTLFDIARYFNGAPKVNALRFNDVTVGDESIVSLISSIDDARNRLANKLRSLLKYNRTNILQAGYAFRNGVLTDKARTSRNAVAFYEPAQRVIEPDPVFGRRLRLRGPSALITGILATIGGYALAMIAVAEGSVEPLAVYWLAVTACTATLIIADATLSLRKKGDIVVFLGLLPLMTLIALFVRRSPK